MDLQRLLDWWVEYTEKNGASLDNNPSPGNLTGGITAILEKSLGAVAKSIAGAYSAVRNHRRNAARGYST